MIPPDRIAGRWDLDTGVIEGCPPVTRRLSQVRDSFADQKACDAILLHDDPVIYTVSTFDLASGPGELHYGLGALYPGRVGDEFFLTRGHFHARREASEIYLGLRGSGVMILQGEDGRATTAHLVPNGFVYVPPRTAHRTVNTGSEKLVYLGVYPADAGHEYGSVDFQLVVIARDGAPLILPRGDFVPRASSDRTP